SSSIQNGAQIPPRKVVQKNVAKNSPRVAKFIRVSWRKEEKRVCGSIRTRDVEKQQQQRR
ncbi:hypothetical protein WMY93_033529, partial [Mugilogobius chulae]